MSKISCDICMDLMPLVKDDIASEDSNNVVIEHISQCEKCNKFFNEIDKLKINNTNIKMNDQKILSKVKNQITSIAIAMIILGSFIGVGISESEWTFYNVILMPIIGGLGYFIFNKKAYIMPICIFFLTFIWNLTKIIIGKSTNEINITDIVLSSGTWAVIYASLCILGVIIGFLLYIAFKKEEKYYEKKY